MVRRARRNSLSRLTGCSLTASAVSPEIITRKQSSFRTSTTSSPSRRTRPPSLKNGAVSSTSSTALFTLSFPLGSEHRPKAQLQPASAGLPAGKRPYEQSAAG